MSGTGPPGRAGRKLRSSSNPAKQGPSAVTPLLQQLSSSTLQYTSRKRNGRQAANRSSACKRKRSASPPQPSEADSCSRQTVEATLEKQEEQQGALSHADPAEHGVAVDHQALYHSAGAVLQLKPQRPSFATRESLLAQYPALEPSVRTLEAVLQASLGLSKAPAANLPLGDMAPYAKRTVLQLCLKEVCSTHQYVDFGNGDEPSLYPFVVAILRPFLTAASGKRVMRMVESAQDPLHQPQLLDDSLEQVPAVHDLLLQHETSGSVSNKRTEFVLADSSQKLLTHLGEVKTVVNFTEGIHQLVARMVAAVEANLRDNLYENPSTVQIEGIWTSYVVYLGVRLTVQLDGDEIVRVDMQHSGLLRLFYCGGVPDAHVLRVVHMLCTLLVPAACSWAPEDWERAMAAADAEASRVAREDVAQLRFAELVKADIDERAAKAKAAAKAGAKAAAEAAAAELVAQAIAKANEALAKAKAELESLRKQLAQAQH